MRNKLCVACGKDLGTSRKIQEHCGREGCMQVWLRWKIEKRIKVVGDCHVWTGSIRKGDVAYLTLVRSIRPLERQDFRVLDVLNPEIESARRNWENLCGTRGCVGITHNRIYVAQTVRPGTRVRAMLPVLPLIEALRRYRIDKDKYMAPRFVRGLEECAKRGTISVTYADEICIDVLGVHPYAVYGEDFYAA